MPRGRPTKYDPKFCDEMVEFMSKGYSFEAFCGKMKVSKDTGYAWVKKYPDFSDAKKEATEQCRIFWEQAGIDGLFADPDGRKINSTVWLFNMKNRFGWRDKQEHQITDTTINLNYKTKSERDSDDD